LALNGNALITRNVATVGGGLLLHRDAPVTLADSSAITNNRYDDIAANSITTA
jgi:hypothetical protein